MSVITRTFYIFVVGFICGFVAMYTTYHYEIYPEMVSWYFPNGVKIVALLILPFRQWLFFLIACHIGATGSFYIVSSEQLVSFQERWPPVAFFIIFEGIAGAVFVFTKKQLIKGSLFRLHSIMVLILLSMAYRLLYMSLAAIAGISIFDLIPENKMYEYFVAQQLSGYLTAFYALNLYLIVLWCKQNQCQVSSQSVFRVLSYALAIVLVCVFVYVARPEVVYLLRIALFVPLILMAMRFGWLGIMLTSFLINTTILFFVFDKDAALLLEYQPYMLSYMLVAFLVGGVFLENDRVKAQMQDAQDALQSKYALLVKMSNNLKLMANRILDLQEHERKTLSQDLHDEVGQNITALKVAVKILEREAEHDNLQFDKYRTLKRSADEIYASIYHFMNWWRPQVLDDFDLYKTLTGQYFEEKLKLANIQYKRKNIVDLALPDNYEIAIFRITQEAVTNAIKHSQASYFSLSLFQDDNCIRLILSNDMRNDAEKEEPSSGEFGLEGIKGRVSALSGECKISNDEQFRIAIALPIAPD